MLRVYEHTIELNHYNLDKYKERTEYGDFLYTLSFHFSLFLSLAIHFFKNKNNS